MIGCKSDINVRDSNVPKANCSSVGPLHFLIASGNMLKKHKAKTKMAKTVRTGLTMSQARQRHLFFFVTPKHKSMSVIKELDNMKSVVISQKSLSLLIRMFRCSISIQMQVTAVKNSPIADSTVFPKATFLASFGRKTALASLMKHFILFLRRAIQYPVCEYVMQTFFGRLDSQQ